MLRQRARCMLACSHCQHHDGLQEPCCVMPCASLEPAMCMGSDQRHHLLQAGVISLKDCLWLQVLPDNMLLLADPSPAALIRCLHLAIQRLPFCSPYQQHLQVRACCSTQYPPLTVSPLVWRLCAQSCCLNSSLCWRPMTYSQAGANIQTPFVCVAQIHRECKI